LNVSLSVTMLQRDSGVGLWKEDVGTAVIGGGETF
jgi:hypothetical protein